MYWTGGCFDEGTKSWKWTDGSVVNYTRWATREPNSRGFRCIALADPELLFSNWEWVDITITPRDKFKYVCEKPLSA